MKKVLAGTIGVICGTLLGLAIVWLVAGCQPSLQVTPSSASIETSTDKNGVVTRKVEVKGSGLKGDNAKDVNIDKVKPISLRDDPKRGVTIGGGGFDGVEFLGNVASNPFFILYIVAFAIFALGVYLWIKGYGYGVAAAGLACFVLVLLADMYSWLFLLGGIVLLGVGIYFLWQYMRDHQALAVVTAGVERAPADAKAAVKEAIAATADETGKKVALDKAIDNAKAVV